jgi:hypothetical protein
MKRILISIILMTSWSFLFAQIDMEQFALDVSKADAANTEQLKAFIWKRHSTATVKGEEKATVINELSFNDKDEIQVTNIDAETTTRQKRGIRGRIQQNAMEDNMEYVGDALQLALAYTYMSKGQLLDFFEKAKATEKDGTIEVSGENVLKQGDQVTVVIDSETKLFVNKKFSSMLGEDPIDGEITYKEFISGIMHGDETILNLPGKNAVINAKNQDYTQRIQ